MFKKKTIAIAVFIILIGFLTTVVVGGNNVRYPFSTDSATISSPGDRIKDGNLFVFRDRVEINKSNLIWAKIKDTHSMEPVLNAGAISLELPPSSTSDIQVGDIISYQYQDKVIIHRVVLLGNDEEGWFAATKGDNNSVPDSYKVRFNDIKGVVVGILY
jgi:signal peptidase I